MMTSDDKVGGWVKKGQNHDDVILEWPLRQNKERIYSASLIIYINVYNTVASHKLWLKKMKNAWLLASNSCL